MLLAEKFFCPPLVEAYLKEQKLNPSAFYELAFKVTIEKKLRSFQFKLLHNIIPANQRLWKMNIKTSIPLNAVTVTFQLKLKTIGFMNVLP